MSGLIGDLTSLGTFFSDELGALENFVDFLATDFETFINSIASDFETFISYIATAVSDLATFAQTVYNDIVSALQNIASAIYPVLRNIGGIIAGAIETALGDLAQFAIDATGALANAIRTITNDIGSLLGTFISDAFQALGNIPLHISPFLAKASTFLASVISPYLIIRALPPAIDKLAELLPDFTISLAPVGLGARFEVKLGEIVKMFGENAADFMKDVSDEMMSTFKEFIKEPFISNFKIQVREIFNDIGLGDIPFADPSFTQIAKWVGARSFNEIKDHLKETVLLTGYAQWFTDAYLQPPVNDFVPQNPLFKPVAIKDVITAVEYGILPADAVGKYAENNLITQKTATLMYQNQNLKLFQRVVEQGIRAFVVEPDKAYQLMTSGVSLSGRDLFTKYFDIEYQFATQRFAKQVLRSLLSRALSNFGRPYIDIQYLSSTTSKIFKELNLPTAIDNLFKEMMSQSQLIQYNQLIYGLLRSEASMGIFDQQKVNELLQSHNFNVAETEYLLAHYANIAVMKEQLSVLKAKANNFFISDQDLGKELTSLGFTPEYIQAFAEENFTLPLRKEIANVYLSLLRKGYYDVKEAKSIFGGLGYEKSVIEQLTNVYSTEIETELAIKTIQQKAQLFLLSQQEIITELKKLQVSDALANEITVEYFAIPLLKQQISVYESLIKKGYLNTDDAKKVFTSLGYRQSVVDQLIPLYATEITADATIAKYKSLLQHFAVNVKTAEQELKQLHISSSLIEQILTEYYQVPLIEKLSAIYLSMLEKGYITIDVLKKVLGPQNIDVSAITEIANAYNYEITVANEIKYVQSLLRNLLIDEKTAEQELKKLNVSDSLVKAIVAESTPVVVSPKTVAQTLIEGAIYHIQKVPVSVSHVIGELKKLNIPDSQVNALIDEIESQIALDIWKKYLPTLSDIESALTYGYPTEKLVQLSLIPAELLNIHVNLTQHEMVGKEVQSLKSAYVKLLTYGIANAQLESLMRQYGVNDQLLSVLRLQAQLEKILTTYQELYLTPSKAISLSEYLSNPTQTLQKVFADYQVPSDLQQIYMEYTRNRRLRTYISQIVETISLLFERHKITLDQAVQYLQQFKQYGLTDEEIQLIKLNWQLREMY
ncbi:putative minor structural protein [Acidianus rod-shaped virus 1]|uniref:Uncharacterized protein n=1 Tax=Acidianus rod-shaped virus 1 TaxID=309181 RepID=Q50I43_9VIRU|nr:putative minor structural protein [Acidianus rod-shaped virus 1]CAI44183.1 hypothetical protein [Acidianus rod-shaped virus 1]